ncbi:MAG: histidine--tRNA ligase [Patescibacteria group bacterium]
MQIQPLRGTQSLYPADMRKRNAFANASRVVLERAGYEEYEAPILEPLVLYEAKSSAEIVERQSYVFTDRGGEKIVVRPELTPSLARMVANRQGQLPPLLRWFSFADCWRYERPQKGRSRNFMQLNIDFLGSDSVEADVEAIDLALSIVQANGMDMTKIEMRVNDRASFDVICNGLKISDDKRGQFLTLLDERGKLTTEEFLAQLQTINATITIGDLTCIEEMKPSERLEAIMDAVLALGWTQLAYDPSLIRGFSYYTGMVFEVFSTSGEYRRAMFGGGRYNDLLQAVGGKPMSAVGFAVSDVSFFAALEAQGKTMIGIEAEKRLIIPATQAESSAAGSIARSLRLSGRTVLLAVPPFDLKKQLTLANRIGAKNVIIISPEELAKGMMIEKDMESGAQTSVAIPV